MTGKPSLRPTMRKSPGVTVGLAGLIQFTTAVRAGHASRPDPVIDAHGLSVATVQTIAHTICGLFETPAFKAHGLAEPPGPTSGCVPDSPPHSWLGKRSRHVAVRLPDYFYDARQPIPECLDFGAGNPRPGPGSFPSWISYKRLQAAADPSNGRNQATGAGKTSLCVDAADYVIQARNTATGSKPADGEPRPAGTGLKADLEAVQLFLAELWAQRKADIFASRLSERVYHVWLPPGNLEPAQQHDVTRRRDLGTLAVVPVVTFVRRPGESVFRRTIAVSIMLVPLRDAASAAGRAYGIQEIPAIVQMISEPATRVHDRAAATLKYALNGPLQDYLNQIAASQADQRPLTADIVTCEWPSGEDRAPAASPSCSHSPAPAATLRQWAELIVTTSVERGIAPGDKPWHSTRELADEIVASLRLSNTWLASILHDNIKPSPGSAGQPDDRASARNAEPSALTRLLSNLAACARASKPKPPDPAGELPAGLLTRIDQPETLDSHAAAWHVHGRRGIVLACNRSNEEFPGNSSLNNFGAFSHLLIAASCSIDMIEALLQEAVWQPDTLHRARSAYDLLVELEDLVDLDAAQPSFRTMWHQYLHALGVDGRYQMVLQRVQLLARYADVKERQEELADRDRELKFEARITLLAASFGLGVLILSDAALFATSPHVHAWTIAVTLVVATFTAVTVALRNRLATAYLKHEHRTLKLTRRRTRRGLGYH